MQIVKHYRDNAALRRSFNELAEATFGLNFENWYQNGFWCDNYEPYSVVENGKVVANVSLNRTDMLVKGQRKRLYQLGTVMTAKGYRNRGYIRAIMKEIEKDTIDADGVYLFANDSVVEFYPKFGFVPSMEHVYSKVVNNAGESKMRQVPMDGPESWQKLRRAMETSTFPTACRMVDNEELIFFYVSQFMQACVYYSEVLGAWVIAELEEGELLIHNVFSANAVTLDQVIAAFGGEVKTVTLGFAPADTEGWTCRELPQEDCHFFVKGEAFRDFSGKKLRIPSLSHA